MTRANVVTVLSCLLFVVGAIFGISVYQLATKPIDCARFCPCAEVSR